MNSHVWSRHRREEWMKDAPGLHPSLPPMILWSIPLFHSLGLPLYMHPPSLSNLISPYIFITPPSPPLPSSSHSVFFLGLFPPGRVADDHTAVFQALIHCRGLVTVQESCNDKAFLLEIQHRCTIVDKPHLHALMTNRPHNNGVITMN